MKLKLLGSFVLLMVLALPSAASASPRTGSISIAEGAPLMNGGTLGQDMTKVSGFYSPETGIFQVIIRFAAPVNSSIPASIYVYPRTDPSGSCDPSPDDGFLISNTEPVYQSLLGTTKKVSADDYEITLENTEHTNVDFRCIFIKIGTYEKTYDELSFYFEGFGPAPVTPIVPAIPTPSSPSPQPTVIPAPPASVPSPAMNTKSLPSKHLLAIAIKKCKKIKNKKKRSKCMSTANKRYSLKKK